MIFLETKLNERAELDVLETRPNTDDVLWWSNNASSLSHYITQAQYHAPHIKCEGGVIEAKTTVMGKTNVCVINKLPKIKTETAISPAFIILGLEYVFQDDSFQKQTRKHTLLDGNL